MLQRPKYKDYLNNTLQTPPQPQKRPITPNSNRPPSSPYSKNYLQDTAHTEKEPTITVIEDKSILKEMKGFQRLTSATKRTSRNYRQQSFERLSGNKSDISPDRKQNQSYSGQLDLQKGSYNLLEIKKDQRTLRKGVGSNSSSDLRKYHNSETTSREKQNSKTQFQPYNTYGYNSTHLNVQSDKTISHIPRSSGNQPSNFKQSNFKPSIVEQIRPKTSIQESIGHSSHDYLVPIQFRNRPKSRERSQNRSRQASQEKRRDHKQLLQEVREKKLQISMNEILGQPSSKSNLSIHDFKMGKKLGEGRFGSVFMVVHKSTGSVFALKRIPKATIKQNMMIDQFALEVRIQAVFDSPYIVSIYAVFDDQQHVYLLLQYLYSGCLYGQLKKKGKYQEKEAGERIYALCKAIEALHLMGVAHRDIKPQNIMMCENQCKLGDFGWATICDSLRTTYCGTTDYVSPQIVQGLEYGPCVDMWCIGVFAFQLLAGKAPFYHLSRQETFKKIGAATPTYPPFFSPEATDFVSKLLKKNPEERMSATEAISHPFLSHVNVHRR